VSGLPEFPCKVCSSDFSEVHTLYSELVKLFKLTTSGGIVKVGVSCILVKLEETGGGDGGRGKTTQGEIGNAPWFKAAGYYGSGLWAGQWRGGVLQSREPGQYLEWQYGNHLDSMRRGKRMAATRRVTSRHHQQEIYLPNYLT